MKIAPPIQALTLLAQQVKDIQFPDLLPFITVLEGSEVVLFRNYLHTARTPGDNTMRRANLYFVEYIYQDGRRAQWLNSVMVAFTDETTGKIGKKDFWAANPEVPKTLPPVPNSWYEVYYRAWADTVPELSTSRHDLVTAYLEAIEDTTD